MHYFKSVTYENGSFRFYFVQEPNWIESSVAVETAMFNVDHESFMLDVLDYIFSGVKVVSPVSLKSLIHSIVTSLTGVYLLRE